MSAAPGAFLVLHPDDTGLTLKLRGVAVEDGAFVLAALPHAAAPVDEPAALAGPAGIAADRNGDIYLSAPADHALLVLRTCDERPERLPCIAGPGSDPGRLRDPRGLAVGLGGVLHVAERGNHRVQSFDLATHQVRGVLGQPDPYATPEPSAAPGRFDRPADVAVDTAGRLYVADEGNSRIQRFLANGTVDAAFATAAAAIPLIAPTHVAVVDLDGSELLLILDRTGGRTRLVASTLDGTPDPARTAALAAALAAAQASPAAGVAAAGGVLYVGDPGGRRVLAFGSDGTFFGVLPGYRGPVAAIALDAQGRLVVHRGEVAPLRLMAGGRAEVGTFVLGPLSVPGVDGWRRLRADVDPLPGEAHVRLLAFTADDAAAVPPPLEEWEAAPADEFDAWIEGAGRYAWIAGRLLGTGGSTPAIRSLRLDEEAGGWLRYLPAIYARDAGARELLERYLALLQSFLDEEDARIAAAPALLDPAGTPDEDQAGRWLDWLAGWVSLELDEHWSGAERRQAVQRAFDDHGRRGTVAGLRDAIRHAMGIRVAISEPAGQPGPWRLGEPWARLGEGTALAAAEPFGAVLGTTATLGRSHLLAPGAEGAPLFQDAAHRFCVAVHAADMRQAADRDALARLVDRERPAHTAWTLHVIAPAGRVGGQARLGVDAIVGRPSGALPLRQGGPPGGRVGERAQVGSSATVI